MITFEGQLSGRQIGIKLADDPEELAYALVELADCSAKQLGEEVAEFVPGGEEGAQKVIRFLRDLADAIEDGS